MGSGRPQWHACQTGRDGSRSCPSGYASSSTRWSMRSARTATTRTAQRRPRAGLRAAAMAPQTAPARAMARQAVEAAVRQILVEMGEDPDRQGLSDTPTRVRRMYARADRRLLGRSRAAASTAPSSTSTTARWWSSRTSPSTACASTTCCRSSAPPRWPTSPRPRDRPVQDPAHRRDVRAPAPGPGAHDPARSPTS